MKNNFIDVYKSWNDYETNLTLFLKKIKKNNFKWKEIFYKSISFAALTASVLLLTPSFL